jgi:cytoskeleton protein RodZ
LNEPLGFRLKSAREASGVALRDIAARTKISVSALEALERNDFSRLPGGIFSRAFVRSYAIAVGLDPETTVQEFLAEVKQSESDAARVASERPEVTPEDRAFLERQKRAIRLLQIAGVLVVIAAGTGAALAWMKWTKTASPASSTSPPIAASAPSAGSTSSAPPPSPAPTSAAPTSAPSTSAPPQPASQQSSPPPSSSPPSVPSRGTPPASPPAASPASSQTLPVTVVPPEAPPPVPVPAEPLTIEFEVTAACFVEIASDGRVSFSKAMQPGERQRIQAQKELRLKVGDAGAFVWSLNGRRARSLGAAGAARQATVNQSNFKRFQR